MKFVEVIYPGLSFFCFLILVVLSAGQLKIYLQHGFKRSKNLAYFCFLSSIFTVNVTIVYSEQFSVDLTRFFVVGLQFVLFLCHYFYLKSLSFFIVIPRLLKKFYLGSMLSLALLALIPAVSYLVFDKHLYFDPDDLNITGRYFLDAYGARLGKPQKLVMSFLSIFALINGLTSLYILNRLRKSSKDIFLIFGLSFNLITMAMEYLILAFTVECYIPILFLANIFEALRMCTLASREALQMSQESTEEVQEKRKAESFNNTDLQEEKLMILGQKLESIMSEKKLYLNPNLRIDDLAKTLKIPAYLASQVIRFSLDKNFNQFVLEYRVREAKRQLRQDPDKNKTILEIAQSSGFNSKSSFNARFKKMVGKTPSEYRKQFIEAEDRESPPRI